MVIVSPLRIWAFPFQIAFSWLINGGDPNHLLTGMSLQVPAGTFESMIFNDFPKPKVKYVSSLELPKANIVAPQQKKMLGGSFFLLGRRNPRILLILGLFFFLNLACKVSIVSIWDPRKKKL